MRQMPTKFQELLNNLEVLGLSKMCAYLPEYIDQIIRVVPAVIKWATNNQVTYEDPFGLEQRLQAAPTYQKLLEMIAADYNELAAKNQYPTLVSDLAAIYWE